MQRVAAILAFLLLVAVSAAKDAGNASVVRGLPVRVDGPHGGHMRYVPKAPPVGLLVVVHGSLSKDGAAIEAAEDFIRRWMAFADEHRLVVVAPAFDQENFGGCAGPGGGYRGLFGREIGADEFLNEIVDAARERLPEIGDKFYLYGHSAGGQFVSRYVVKHPNRIKAAVISAAGTFAFPDPNVKWTNGMKPLKRRMRWSDDEPWKDIEIVPDPNGWRTAAQLPITVVVGAKDTEKIKPIPGNPGEDHVERARHWVQAMNALAAEHGEQSQVRFVEVKNVGHNSRRLTPACQKALEATIAKSQ